MSQCYGMFRQKITALKGRKPCGPTNATVPVVPCCSADDTCLSNGICHYDTRSIVGGSGYYVAACTDPAYKDKNCRKICTSQSRTDIVYNSKSGRWHCCGADSRNNANCDNATNDVVDVPAPTLLQTYWPTSNATSTSSPQQSPPSGLSPGAAGGIGAGVGVVVLALVGLGIFFLVRRRRRQQLGNFDPTSPHQSSAKSQYVSVSQEYQAELSSQSGANAYAYDATQPRHELLHMASPVEVAGIASPQELPAGEASRATSSGSGSGPRNPDHKK